MRRPNALRWLIVGTTGAAAWIAVEAAVLADPVPGACDLGVATNRVIEAFSVQRGRDVWQHVPNLGRSPELEIDGPLAVYVFEGEFTVPPAFMLPNPMASAETLTYTTVVCVVLPDGSANLYPGVDLQGLRP